MTSSNVEIVRESYEHFRERGDIAEHIYGPDFVWDMSTFEGWPEQQQYEGIAGAREFLSNWVSQWDNWELEVRELIDAGDRVVAVCHQSGESKLSGASADMDFVQVWTLRDGQFERMQMYSDVGEALARTGLADAGADQPESDATRRSAS